MGLPMNTRTMSYALGLALIIPIGGTLFRIIEIAVTGNWALAFDPEFVDRLPLFVHGLSMVAFLVLGAVQLSPKIRATRPKLHRTLGRMAGAGAILGGASGVWMTLLHLEISTPLLLLARLLFGTAMAAFTILAIRAAIRRNFIEHRAWIIRAYAIALNAGTFPIFYLPFVLIMGEPEPLIDEAFQVAGWMINLAVAEKFVIARSVHEESSDDT